MLRENRPTSSAIACAVTWAAAVMSPSLSALRPFASSTPTGRAEGSAAIAKIYVFWTSQGLEVWGLELRDLLTSSNQLAIENIAF